MLIICELYANITIPTRSFIRVWSGDPGYLGKDFDKKRREILSMAESGVLCVRSSTNNLLILDYAK